MVHIKENKRLRLYFQADETTELSASSDKERPQTDPGTCQSNALTAL